MKRFADLYMMIVVVMLGYPSFAGSAGKYNALFVSTDDMNTEIGCYGKRPSFVFILADDLGWSDTSVAMLPGNPSSKSPYIETPNLQRLAGEGMVFSDAYSPAPICTPTRRSIQFGMTPARQHGTEFQSRFSPKPHLSIPRMLKKIDPEYVCAHFGKWGEVMTGTFDNRKSQEPGLPANLGYDFSDGGTGNKTGGFYHHKLDKENWPRNYKCEAEEDPKKTFSVSARACDFLRRQKESGQPFYLQVSYYAVHAAAQARKAAMQKYAAKGPIPVQAGDGIAPMADDMDAGVGLVLDALDNLGLADNTYVFFTSDNGGSGVPVQFQAPGYKERKSRNHPLRQEKQWLYEGGVRVPFIARGPGIPRRSLCREPIIAYDIWKTLYDLAGGTFAVSDQVDAVSIAPVWRNAGSAHLDRPGSGLVFHRPHSNIRSHSALRRGNFKLIVQWKEKTLELYDLSSDIGERKDLSRQKPEVVQRMYAELIDYLRSVKAEGAEYYSKSER